MIREEFEESEEYYINYSSSRRKDSECDTIIKFLKEVEDGKIEGVFKDSGVCSTFNKKCIELEDTPKTCDFNRKKSPVKKYVKDIKKRLMEMAHFE